MCSYKSWYYNDNGYVLQCEQCNSFQVCFGTTMLTLNEVNFRAFVKMVLAKKQRHISVNNANCKCIVLPTPDSCIHSILTENELNELNAMLQEADTEMQTAQLIELFYSTGSVNPDSV